MHKSAVRGRWVQTAHVLSALLAAGGVKRDPEELIPPAYRRGGAGAVAAAPVGIGALKVFLKRPKRPRGAPRPGKGGEP